MDLSRPQAEALRATLTGGAAVYGPAGRVAKNTAESLARAGLAVLGRRRSPFPGRPGLPAYRLTEEGVRQLLRYSSLGSAGGTMSLERWVDHYAKAADRFGFYVPAE